MRSLPSRCLRKAVREKPVAHLWRFASTEDMEPQRLLHKPNWYPCDGEPAPFIKPEVWACSKPRCSLRPKGKSYRPCTPTHRPATREQADTEAPHARRRPPVAKRKMTPLQCPSHNSPEPLTPAHSIIPSPPHGGVSPCDIFTWSIHVTFL